MTRFYFRKIALDEPLISEVYRLRYKVYCEEWGFEKPEDHPGGLETDEYDPHSLHFGAFSQESGNLIGTIRLILNSELGFPIENHCSFSTELSWLNKDNVAEISRLAVSKEYRKRAVDSLIYNDGEIRTDQKEAAKEILEKRKQEFFIIMGLYTCMYMESARLGLTHWYAVMAKGLRILLRRMSIQLLPIGPEVEYHGLRVPYLGTIADILKNVSAEKAEFFTECQKSVIIE
ncbi:MAG: PEP-CTERM/exosortase system-associated acyltransferase [Geobacter sp.]|nr:MAG: PEP-CTERM/exosortase system-associated acyltransferase [Geobacter sp.]